ncbi:MAG: hypothetical protein WBG32_10855 [Nodosilinea sp.]
MATKKGLSATDATDSRYSATTAQHVAAFGWLQGRDRDLYLGENTSHCSDFTKLANRFL